MRAWLGYSQVHHTARRARAFHEVAGLDTAARFGPRSAPPRTGTRGHGRHLFARIPGFDGDVRLGSGAGGTAGHSTLERHGTRPRVGRVRSAGRSLSSPPTYASGWPRFWIRRRIPRSCRADRRDGDGPYRDRTGSRAGPVADPALGPADPAGRADLSSACRSTPARRDRRWPPAAAGPRASRATDSSGNRHPPARARSSARRRGRRR